jgi:hypothetical protein
MAFRRPRLRRVLVLLLVAAWLPAGPGAAQEAITVRTSPPDVSRFPTVSVFLSVWDTTGLRIGGLGPTSFEILEDEIPISSASVQEVEVGVRAVFAINLSGGMRVRDPYGQSRFDQVRSALLAWWQSPGAGFLGVDDLTLLTSDGVLVSHAPAAAQLASSLSSFAPGSTAQATDLDLVLEGLDFTSDPGPHPGMPSILVFLTPLPEGPDDLSLVNAIARANESGTVVYPILVGSPEAATVPQASSLRQLAEGTGGTLLVLDPEAGLQALATQSLERRTQYQIIYDSQASVSGSHTVQVRLVGPEVEALSDPRSYEITILPPEVALIDPPHTIERGSDDISITVDALPPTSYPFHVLVTFPDSHPRPIVSSRLTVDGEVVAQRDEEPFDQLEWDLTGVLDTASVEVQASVADSLGLQGFSLGVPVSVTVVEPPRGLAALRPAIGPLAAVIVILAAGIALAIGLAPTGRRQPGSAEAQGSPARRRGLRRASLQPQLAAAEAEALLIPLEDDAPSFPLTGADVHLGRDASMASLPIDDPSVSGVHAKILRLADGDYLVRDLDSVAGTWVNFRLVPEAGTRLHHGDVIGIGRAAYRFVRASSPPARPVRVEPAHPIDESSAASRHHPLPGSVPRDRGDRG